MTGPALTMTTRRESKSVLSRWGQAAQHRVLGAVMSTRGLPHELARSSALRANLLIRDLRRMQGPVEGSPSKHSASCSAFIEENGRRLPSEDPGVSPAHGHLCQLNAVSCCIGRWRSAGARAGREGALAVRAWSMHANRRYGYLGRGIDHLLPAGNPQRSLDPAPRHSLRNASTSRAKSAWCWNRNPCAASW
jgi:hypothetical protein